MHRIQTVVFSDGERFPVMLDGSGVPHWHATLYVTTQVRNASKAPNTMQAILSAVRTLLVWAGERGVDLESRFARREFLIESEMESLRAFTQAKIVAPEPDKEDRKIVRLPRRVESARLGMMSLVPRVSSQTQYIRLTYIADFLEWYAARIVEREARHIDEASLAGIKSMANGVRIRRPQKKHRSILAARRGLSPSTQQKLLDLVRIGSKLNPFDELVQRRNYLIVLLLLRLGLRAGELLALKVRDFDFQKNEIVIARRHGDKSDPRKNQPVVKTLDRRIPLENSLARDVADYVMSERRLFPRARRHEFLFVTHKVGPFLGQPLSAKGLGKIFALIQKAGTEELVKLSPHILRHTANDNFSRLMEERKVPEAVEEKMRSYLMGWKEGSGSASIYTRRYIEEKAREAFLILQNRKK